MVKYNYDAWVNWINKENTGQNALGNELVNINPFIYKGYIYDEETDFYYLKSRYYSPKIRRFINVDSEIGEINNLEYFNLFCYCINNPVNLAYEDGNWPRWFKWVVTIAIVAVIAVTIATAGIGTTIAGFLGGGVIATIVESTTGGIITGAITGSIFSFGISVINQGLTNEYNSICWDNVKKDVITGAVSGAILGGIFGALSGTGKIINAAKLWDKRIF